MLMSYAHVRFPWVQDHPLEPTSLKKTNSPNQQPSGANTAGQKWGFMSSSAIYAGTFTGKKTIFKVF